MLPTTTFSCDGVSLATYRWQPSAAPKAIVQIAHGMAEHAPRYDSVARGLNDAGYVVYAHDHRGHGKTAEGGLLGHLADADGWNLLVNDIGIVGRRARAEHPGIPLVLLGHSMGSLAARAFAIRHSDDIDALVVVGTASDPGLLGKVGKAIAAIGAKARGSRASGKLLNTMTFGAYNARFKPNRTEFDWLSRDPAAVDDYVADPLCGFVPTVGFFHDLLGGVREINDEANVAQVRRDLPIYLFSGDCDPVSDGGRGVQAACDTYERLGVNDLTLRLYPGGRHEILNETNADEVIADLVAWLDAHVTPSPRSAGSSSGC